MEWHPKRERIVIRDGQAVSMPIPESERPPTMRPVELPDPNVYDAAGHRIGNYL